MAAVSAAQPSGSLSRNGSPEEHSSWTYSGSEAIEQSESLSAFKAPNSHSQSIQSAPKTRQPLANQLNGASLAQKGSRQDLNGRHDTNESLRAWRSNNNSTPDQLAVPARVNALGRKDSNISGASEPDSLLELYDNHSTTRSVTGSMDSASKRRNGGKKHGEKYYTDDDDLDNSDWIHRDKLARIESREMAQAGLNFGRTSRSASRSASRHAGRRDDSEDRHRPGPTTEQPYTPHQVTDEKQITPPIPDDEEDSDGEQMNWDLRTPEEAAMDLETRRGRGMESHPSLSKRSYSRIPLSTSSPVPVRQDYIARNAPLPRTASNGWDEDGIAYPKSRGRAQSVGSQVLLDDYESPEIFSSPDPTEVKTPASESPTKARAPTKATPTSRKAPVPTQARPRTRSGANRDTSSQSRPVTRSGSTPPTTHKRPEGDPPWLATMYKPDPRLPPDQQVIPTHAKRMMQEQWEKEGRPGAVYDKDFNVLDLSQVQPKPTPSQPEENPEQKADLNGSAVPANSNAEWPLRIPKSPNLQHGGYKTTPSVPLHNPIPQPQTAQGLGVKSTASGPPMQDKKEAGCGCCVIM